MIDGLLYVMAILGIIIMRINYRYKCSKEKVEIRSYHTSSPQHHKFTYHVCRGMGEHLGYSNHEEFYTLKSKQDLHKHFDGLKHILLTIKEGADKCKFQNLENITYE